MSGPILKADKGAAKAYFLLCQALKKANKVAIVRFTFKNHNHVGVIEPYENVLLLNQLRFHSQILPVESLELEKVRVSTAEVDIAEQLIAQLSGPFKPERFHDTYIEDLKKTISKKGRGKKVSMAKEKEKKAKVYDIMSLLKESLKEQKPAAKSLRKKK